MTFKQFKEKFLEQHLSSSYESYLRQDLRKRKQGPTEPALSYAIEMESMARKAYPNFEDTDLVTLICEG